MMKCIKLMVVIMSMLVMCLVGSRGVSAEEMSFSVEAQLPDNQVNKNKTYFDLRVKPGTQEDLKVELRNNKDEEVVVEVQANTAITNGNGVIDYGEGKPELDKSLISAFGEMASVEPEFTLAPKETKVVTIPVTIPSDSFDGIILGGLYFTQKEGKSDTKADAGMQIENKFAYVIGVRLSENDEPVKADLKLVDVMAGQRNYRNVVLANLQNPTPRILSDMVVTANVYGESNTETPVFYSKQENISMAPNSNFDYGIKMDNKAFKAGKYRLKMVVQADGQEWEFEKAFEIKADEAKKFNDEAVDLIDESPDNLLYFIIGGSLLALIIMGLISWLVMQKRRHRAEIERKAKKSKRKSSSRKKG